MEKSLFSGRDTIDFGEVKKGELRNTTSDVRDRLREFGWQADKLAGCVCLMLSADNKRVEDGFLVTRGPIEVKEMRIEANKIWPTASADVFLLVKLASADIFSFSEGGLCSDFVNMDKIHHVFYKMEEGRSPTVVLEADYEEMGVGSFCMRMTCVPSDRSTARRGAILKATTLLFPEEREVMLATYSGAKSMAWPGLRVTESELVLWPMPTVAWKCPVIPLMLPGIEFSACQDLPASESLRSFVGAIMSKAAVAETARTGAAVVARWKRLASNPDELRLDPGPVTWPAAAVQQPEQGE